MMEVTSWLWVVVMESVCVCVGGLPMLTYSVSLCLKGSNKVEMTGTTEAKLV